MWLLSEMHIQFSNFFVRKEKVIISIIIYIVILIFLLHWGRLEVWFWIENFEHLVSLCTAYIYLVCLRPVHCFFAPEREVN